MHSIAPVNLQSSINITGMSRGSNVPFLTELDN